MASPFVAGLAALMLDANPSLTPAQVKALIKSTALDWGPAGNDIDYGSGRVDGYEAARNAFVTPPLGTNVAVPNHSFVLDSLEGTGVLDSYSINVVDATKPISIIMIMPTWSSSSSPDFDIRLKNPSGTQIAVSEGVTRQESISISITLIGTYTLEVFSYAGNGSYFVDISAGSS
jgi:serine protease AprX